ncbi:MAG: DUF58 domain-containing protein [Proteobacteria bacterium]|nr:DUF58 domain-containing protein [Pseudomonadota bacterium]
MFSGKDTPSGPIENTPEKELLKKVRKIHIRSKRMVNDVMAGEYQSAFKGRGMEFDMVREYYEGDEPRLIDWNVTARMGHPYVRSYVEERELTIMFLVDISASGVFGSVEYFKKEVAAELCAVLALNAIKKNDKVGLLLFTDQIELYVPPKKGKTHVLRIIRELLFLKPGHKGTSIKSALEFFRRMQKKRVVLFLVSDFLDRDYFQSMNIINKKHDLVALEIVDPLEEQLPDVGLLELEDPETGNRTVVDTSSKLWRKEYREVRYQFDERKKTEFRKMKIDHLRIRTDQPFEQELVKFFKKRGTKA